MEGSSLKFVTYNIHKGFNSGGRRFTLNRMRGALHSLHPDFIFLQEVLGEHSGYRRKIKAWPVRSQLEFLAHGVWPHFVYGKNAIYENGHHGNAILSKYPIQYSENIDITTNRLERRGLLHGVFRIPGTRKSLHAISVHLGLLEAERAQQIQMLCARIDSHVPEEDPLVIGGDFNDWRGRVSGSLRERLGLLEAYQHLYGHHARTFPSWLPALRLDRIYYRGLRVRSARCLSRAPWNGLSDHSALSAELTF